MKASRGFSVIHHDAAPLHSLTANDLDTRVGGDFWGGYTSALSKDWKQATNRGNKAIYYNAVNGHWNPAQFAYHTAGVFADAARPRDVRSRHVRGRRVVRAHAVTAARARHADSSRSPSATARMATAQALYDGWREYGSNAGKVSWLVRA